VLNSIGDEQRSRLLRLAIRRRFSRGEVVFHEGDPGDSLHIVTTGVFVARSSSSLGDLIGVNMFCEGSVFGELALLTTDHYRSATIVAVHGGATLMITRTHFDDLRVRTPAIDRFLISVLAERNRALNAQLVELLFTPVEQRVYRSLLAFAAAIGAEPGDSWIQLRQSDLATLAGTTRSTTNRILRRAEKRGLVQLARGRVRVIDARALGVRACSSRAMAH
jgi:CRP/FNR family cyclic AMP-dependent transcriptional regulator